MILRKILPFAICGATLLVLGACGGGGGGSGTTNADSQLAAYAGRWSSCSPNGTAGSEQYISTFRVASATQLTVDEITIRHFNSADCSGLPIATVTPTFEGAASIALDLVELDTIVNVYDANNNAVPTALDQFNVIFPAAVYKVFGTAVTTRTVGGMETKVVTYAGGSEVSYDSNAPAGETTTYARITADQQVQQSTENDNLLQLRPVSSRTPQTQVGEAQGYYQGTFVSPNLADGRFRTLILENDEFWTFYGTETSPGNLSVYGLLHGQAQSDNGIFVAENVTDYWSNNTGPFNDALSARYSLGISFKGELAGGSGTGITFDGGPALVNSSGQGYNYETSPNPSEVIGDWTGQNLSGAVSTFAFNSDGTFSRTSSGGCVLSGTFEPRASGKNVFDLTGRYADTTECQNAAGQTVHGIGINYVLSNGVQSQLLLAYDNASRDVGTVFYAVR